MMMPNRSGDKGGTTEDSIEVPTLQATQLPDDSHIEVPTVEATQHPDEGPIEVPTVEITQLPVDVL